jgi:hypothetical protein
MCQGHSKRTKARQSSAAVQVRLKEGPVWQSHYARDACAGAMPGASIFDHADTHPDVKCGEECSLVRLQASACGNARRVVHLIPMLLQLRGALWRACVTCCYDHISRLIS